MIEARMVWQKALVGAVLASLASAAHADSEKQTQTAANGVELTVYADDFADRYEYGSPEVKPNGADGAAWVTKTRKQGKWSQTAIAVFLSYRGDWRYYLQAILRGGEQIATVEGSREVISCSGSSRSGCLLSETLVLNITPEQVARAGASGSIDIQIGSRSGPDVMLSLPVSYIEAIDKLDD